MIHPMIEKVAEKLRRHRLNSFEHQATATIRAALEYARDNVSDRMEAAGEEIPDEVFVDEAKNVFRAMIDTLLKEIEE